MTKPLHRAKVDNFQQQIMHLPVAAQLMMAAGMLHANIVLKRKRYSLSVLHVMPSIIIDLLMVQQPV